MVDLTEVVDEGRLLRSVLERQRADPVDILLCPPPRLRWSLASAEKELAQALAFRGTRVGAMTSHSTPIFVSCQYSAKSVGPRPDRRIV
jgi:hypothetical protein